MHPPNSINDIAYHITAILKDGSTWSAIEETEEKAKESTKQQCEKYPDAYKLVMLPMRCEIVNCGFGLVWKVSGYMEFTGKTENE